MKKYLAFAVALLVSNSLFAKNSMPTLFFNLLEFPRGYTLTLKSEGMIGIPTELALGSGAYANNSFCFVLNQNIVLNAYPIIHTFFYFPVSMPFFKIKPVTLHNFSCN